MRNEGTHDQREQRRGIVPAHLLQPRDPVRQREQHHRLARLGAAQRESRIGRHADRQPGQGVGGAGQLPFPDLLRCPALQAFDEVIDCDQTAAGDPAPRPLPQLIQLGTGKQRLQRFGQQGVRFDGAAPLRIAPQIAAELVELVGGPVGDPNGLFERCGELRNVRHLGGKLHLEIGGGRAVGQGKKAPRSSYLESVGIPFSEPYEEQFPVLREGALRRHAQPPFGMGCQPGEHPLRGHRLGILQQAANRQANRQRELVAGPAELRVRRVVVFGHGELSRLQKRPQISVYRTVHAIRAAQPLDLGDDGQLLAPVRAVDEESPFEAVEVEEDVADVVIRMGAPAGQPREIGGARAGMDGGIVRPVRHALRLQVVRPVGDQLRRIDERMVGFPAHGRAAPDVYHAADLPPGYGDRFAGGNPARLPARPGRPRASRAAGVRRRPVGALASFDQ